MPPTPYCQGAYRAHVLEPRVLEALFRTLQREGKSNTEGALAPHGDSEPFARQHCTYQN